MVQRRTISLVDEVHQVIQDVRGDLLKQGIELSFTEIVNMMLIAGVFSFKQLPDAAKREAVAAAQKVCEQSNLDVASVADTFTDIGLRKLLKK